MEYRKYITREMLKNEPEKLFVFGDNLERRGLGGQAKEMRGEPNAVGIPTKKKPTMSIDAFLTDDDFMLWHCKSVMDWVRIIKHIEAGKIVVWPEDGIGTGRARLNATSPRIFAWIKSWEEEFNNLSEGKSTLVW